MTTRRLEIDWHRCALELRKSVGSLARAARLAGVDAVLLQRLARGDQHEPRFSAGAALLSLHSQQLGAKTTAALRRQGRGAKCSSPC